MGIEEIEMRFQVPLLKARAAILRCGVFPVAGFAIKLLGGGPRLRRTDRSDLLWVSRGVAAFRCDVLTRQSRLGHPGETCRPGEAVSK